MERPLRLLAFAKYGLEAASTRYRITQYAPSLRSSGIELEISDLLDDDYVRALASGQRYPKLQLAKAYARRIRQVLFRKDFDAALVYLDLFPGLPLEGFVHLGGKPIIYDADDAIFHNYAYDKFTPLWRRSHAICGNTFLAQHIAQHALSTTVIPTVLDTDIWYPSPSSGSPVIGWIGSPSTWTYVEPLLPVIKSACDATGAKFRVVGAGVAADRHEWIERLPWSLATEVALTQSMSIGIMPLPDNEWTRGKCGFKLIQYMACGLPVIASPVGGNRKIARGCGLMAHDDRAWSHALFRLLGDADLRRTFGMKGRERAVSSYSLARQAPKFVETIRKATATHTVEGYTRPKFSPSLPLQEQAA